MRYRGRIAWRRPHVGVEVEGSLQFLQAICPELKTNSPGPMDAASFAARANLNDGNAHQICTTYA
jgi:hypothetical protein